MVSNDRLMAETDPRFNPKVDADPGTPGYPGTDEPSDATNPGTRGYPAVPIGTGSDARETFPPDPVPPGTASYPPPEEVLAPASGLRWQEMGFPTFEAFLKHADDLRRAARGFPPLKPSASRRRPPAGLTRQTNIKLAPDDHDSLVKLAAEQGVTPTTMARMIVIRELRLGD